MKEITREMIKLYQLNKLRFDFMGYTFNRYEELSYHHNIVAKSNGGLETIENGAILARDTSHDYIHLIENIDEEIFFLITSEMIDENLKGYLDTQNLLAIDDLLTYFEREHCSDRTNKGVPIIKEQYTRRLVRNGKFGR